MSKPIFTSLAPNTEWDDVGLAARLMFQPWRWRQGRGMSQLEQLFQEWLPTKYAYAFSSGRAALYAILKALNLSADDEVLLQAYTCVAVPDPILWAGAKPIYTDCEEETFNMDPRDLERKITPRSRVLIIQHTFGLPADIDALIKIAKKYKLFVIEDCAHALGAKYESKRVGLPAEAQRAKVGTFGDAAFFSFGRDKVISSVFGGMLTVKDKAIAREVGEIIAHWKVAPWSWVLQQLLHPITTTKAKTFYRVLGFGKLILSLAKTLRIISKAVYPEEKRGERPAFLEYRMPNALALLALQQFGKLERFNAHRKKIAKIYDERLGLRCEGDRVSENQTNSIYLRYTIQTPNAAEILAAAKNKNIFLGDWYRTPIAPAGVDYNAVGYTMGSCPTAEKLARESINLPTDVHIGQREVQRIIEVMREYV